MVSVPKEPSGKQAVLIVGFNRPELTKRVIDAVRAYAPPRVYLSCDGARPDNPTDKKQVQAVIDRFSDIHWNCEVHTKFEDHNLGLRQSMVKSIDWFFAHEAEGIILEDDCLPIADFFSFAEEILARYRNSPRVWGVTGSNSEEIPLSGPGSYAFVRTALVWGWASWSDRWAPYDRDLEEFRTSVMRNNPAAWPSLMEYHALNWLLNSILDRGVPNSWAYPLAWTVVANDGLWVLPKTNLVENTGFGSAATNTRRQRHQASTLPIGTIDHPPTIARDARAQEMIHERLHRVLRPMFLNYLRDCFRRVSKGSGRVKHYLYTSSAASKRSRKSKTRSATAPIKHSDTGRTK